MWVYQIVRQRSNPDNLDVTIDYYMGEEGWAPNFLAFRYDPTNKEQLKNALDVLHELINNNEDHYTRFFPVKVSLENLS